MERAFVTGLCSSLEEHSSWEMDHATKSENCDISRNSPERTGGQIPTLSPDAVLLPFPIR